MLSTYNVFPAWRSAAVSLSAKAIRCIDTITSHCQPWRAVYLMGPGTEVPQQIAASTE